MKNLPEGIIKLHDDALEVFQQKKLGVTQDIYFEYIDNKLCGCGVAAAYYKHKGRMNLIDSVEDFCTSHYKITMADVVDFIHGFDEEDSKLIDINNNSVYEMGRKLFQTVNEDF